MTVFAITGTLSQPRAVYKEMIERCGHKLASSITNEVDYLVIGDGRMGHGASNKINAARAKGVPLIGESQLMTKLRSSARRSTKSSSSKASAASKKNKSTTSTRATTPRTSIKAIAIRRRYV